MTSVPAFSDSSVFIRPTAGVGFMAQPSGKTGGSGYDVGGRILLATNEFQKYGIEVSSLDGHRFNGSREEGRYLCTGIVLEQRLFNWFHMGIGTVGYIAQGRSKSSPFGLTTTLGWEPDLASWHPLIAYRSDLIIDRSKKLYLMESIVFGAGLKL